MTYLLACGLACGQHKVPIADVLTKLKQHLTPSLEPALAFLNKLSDVGIETKALEITDPPTGSYSQRNQLALETALTLGLRAIADLNQPLTDVTHLLACTSTVSGAPSLDAHLLTKLKLKPETKRYSLQGQACASLGSVLDLANNLCQAQAKPVKILVVVVDVTSPYSLADLDHYQQLDQAQLINACISEAIFSDGAAAFLLTNQPTTYQGKIGLLEEGRPSSEPRYYRLTDSRAFTVADSLDFMAIRPADHSMLAKLHRQVDQVMADHVSQVTTDNTMPLFHPGGKSILNRLGQSYPVTYSQLILRKYGNMSAPSLAHVFRAYLANQQPAEQQIQLISFGQGIYLNSLLIESYL